MKTFDHPGAEQVFNQLQAARKKDKLFEAAYRWWCSKRPVGWTEEQHLENPAVNLTGDATGSESALAAQIASLVSVR